MSEPIDFEQSCGICRKLRNQSEPVFENELWHVRTVDEPNAVPGWVMLITRRHVAGPAQFNQREIESFGPTLCHLQQVLLEVTGAMRIYTAAMGESSPHFHAHFVPRYAEMPKDAKAWGVFDLMRAAGAGEVSANPEQNARIAAAYGAALASAPPR